MATAQTQAPASTLTIRNPATKQVVGTVPIMSPAEVDATIARARVASQTWSRLPMDERVKELGNVRRALARHADELAELIHRENGKPMLEAMTEVFTALSHLQHAPARAPKVLAPHKVPSGVLANFRATISYFPFGVIGVIGPWNYPLHTPMGSIAYALAAGNCVVWKPSELTPLIAVKVAEIAQATFSIPDVLQVVTGAGETGAALARGAVDKISFTGSAATGKRVMMAAAERLTPVLLELGGKDPMIVTDDADVGKAAEACVYGALTNAGQACVSVERVYVTPAIHDAFVKEVVAQVKKLKVGGDDGDLGAMTSSAQVAIVRDHLKDAVERGATVHTGGPDAISENYIQPTVLTDVDHTMKIMIEETFGPVIPIAKVESIDDAVERANDSRFGLGSTVFGGKLARAVADRLRAGMSSINSVLGFAGVPSLPFGGIGDSGFGRIHGDEGLREFSRVKSTAEQVVPLPPLNMMTFNLPAQSTTQRLRTMIHHLHGDGALAKAKALFGK